MWHRLALFIRRNVGGQTVIVLISFYEWIIYFDAEDGNSYYASSIVGCEISEVIKVWLMYTWE